MKRALSQREVNGLVMDVFTPMAEQARGMWGAECADDGPWTFGFGWGVGAGHSLYDHGSPVGVHIDGAGGRFRFYLPYQVAYEVAERHAEAHPEVLARINREWLDELAHDELVALRDDELAEERAA